MSKINQQKVDAMEKVLLAIDSEANNITKHFTQFLKPKYVSTDPLRREVFKIRHNVYCEELALESTSDDGLELDEFDVHSIFALVQHKPTDKYTGCVRIVHSPSEDQLLPIEKFCYDSIKNKDYDPKRFNRTEICEISRLAVEVDFRRRKSDPIAAINQTSFPEAERRCFPFIAVGLYMIACALMIEKGLKHAYVMIEHRLARSMKFIGVKFVQIGDPIEYHGLRAPYYINPEIFVENLSSGFKNLYEEIQKDISNQY